MKRLRFQTIEIETDYGLTLKTKGSVGKYKIEHSLDLDAQFHCLSIRDTETQVLTENTQDTTTPTIDLWQGTCHVRVTIVYVAAQGWCVLLEGN